MTKQKITRKEFSNKIKKADRKALKGKTLKTRAKIFNKEVKKIEKKYEFV